MKPELKYENGKLVIKASIGVDNDHDGKSSLAVGLQVEVDAVEAIGEIMKDEVPGWLKDLVAAKA